MRAPQGTAHGVEVGGVPLDHLDVRRPWPVLQAAGVPGEHADSESGRQQLRDEPASDVPGDPGHQGEPCVAEREALDGDGAVSRLRGVLGHVVSLTGSTRLRTPAGMTTSDRWSSVATWAHVPEQSLERKVKSTVSPRA